MLTLTVAVFGLLCAGAAGAGGGQPSGAEARGLQYECRVLASPRPLRVHCLRADLAAERIEPKVIVAPDPDQAGPAEAALTSPLTLVSNRPVVAFVNASRWDGLPDADGNRDRSWHDGQPVDVMGLAASGGRVLSPGSPEYVSVWWDAKGRLGMGVLPAGEAVAEGLAGSCQLVSNGMCVARSDEKLAPRTALGTDQGGRFLWLVVVDGRQPGFSEGMSYGELAEQMLKLGCWNAAALDGGGSSIMGVAGTNGVLAVVNSPSDRDPLGRVRIRPIPVALTVQRREGTGALHSRVESPLAIGRVPAAFPVGFCLLTQGRHQYVGYYDDQRRMTVASRALDEEAWRYQVLPSTVGWDSHNGIVMAADDEGCLHLCGNMHASPLVYFRTSRPADIASFERLDKMTGRSEDSCTYPVFMRGADRELIFHYRAGGSGNGNEIFNVYVGKSRQWRRLLDKPLTDGKGRMNAYLSGPARGPDSWFHLSWVWRDTPDCQTNHDPSYARSRDLLHWETMDGRPLDLPITPEARGAIIDAVPAQGGVINGALHIGFDSASQPLASYHKFDEKGNSQVYVARFEDGRWVPRRITDWDYRWDFKGGGTIVAEITLGSLRPHGRGKLALPYRHVRFGEGLLVLDEKTLALLGTETEPATSRYPAQLCRPESAFKGMEVRWAEDAGRAAEPTARYVLRWETLPANRDGAPEGPMPEPSMLRLYKLAE